MFNAVAKSDCSRLRCAWIALIFPVVLLAALGDPGSARCLAWRTMDLSEGEQVPAEPTEDDAESVPATAQRGPRGNRKISPRIAADGLDRPLDLLTLASATSRRGRQFNCVFRHFKHAGIGYPQLC